MKLYSHPLSLFSAKVRIALAEKGLACELEDVPLNAARGYEPKHPRIVLHNPKQQVPVLIDGDLVLYDSTVILEYLEDLAPEPALYPREVRARARCRQLELEADEVFFAPIGWLIQRRYARAAGVAEDPTERPRAEDAFTAHCQRLSRQLADSSYLCGQFSVADVGHFLVSCYGHGFGMELPQQLESLHRWFERIAARPSVARELASMGVAWQALTRTPDAAAADRVAP